MWKKAGRNCTCMEKYTSHEIKDFLPEFSSQLQNDDDDDDDDCNSNM